ncbi:hypothetical protein [Gloeocapsa sp. PCC 73106]|uniref:hypothetical protein n=1 Tax=Gloeocapsa sp. PCC 73106 TaxID=102232 RepID=UPI0002ACF46E|nr:hypothetical protein [Gloeocapsa sp. PCC 73106]ELR96784.1 hypothetical protein GLO73106DRAFT_00005830 [Gloeocapsa sp. PCC 73106]
MFVNKIDYEELLSQYTNPLDVIILLKEYRPYLEKLPSLRRADESLITIPLPIATIRYPESAKTIQLPCEVAILMCDPDWKIKLAAEILIFIHRPQEELSELLSRWRQIQVYFSYNHDWLMPKYAQHMLNEGSNKVYPLFILFSETPERIKRGLTGASLPFIIQPSSIESEEKATELLSSPTSSN